ncbi:cystathionine beta-lyase [Erythrobacteraceae bacterium CFH 75059]|nr:cystathionine beta-lyase [Erythrobacteraceae bacterium CFH 75059]
MTAGRAGEWAQRTVNPPLWRASTHLFPDCASLRAARPDDADGHRFFYGRQGGPTHWALETALTELEPGAAGAVLYPSGLAAVTGALLTVLHPGDTLLLTRNVYGPTRAFAADVLAQFGVRVRTFDPLDHAAFSRLCREGAAAIMLESPGSLTFEVTDVPALAAIARAQGAAVLIDNTWATSLGFPALTRGCDIAVTALTKHAGGHSDVLMGACTAGPEWHERLRHMARLLGHVVSPDDAALVLRGLRTLPLRLARQQDSAVRVAGWLSGRSEVAEVRCPLLPGDPGHALWRRDFAGGCGLFAFALRGTSRERDSFVDALRRFGIGYSWGGFESLALPIDPPGAAAPMVRLSVGLEDTDDLLADLDQAFSRLRA